MLSEIKRGENVCVVYNIRRGLPNINVEITNKNYQFKTILNITAATIICGLGIKNLIMSHMVDKKGQHTTWLFEKTNLESSLKIPYIWVSGVHMLWIKGLKLTDI